MKKCPICGGNVSTVTTSINTGWGDYEVIIKGVKAARCENCEEEYFDSDEVDIIQSIAAGLSESKQSNRPEVLNVEDVADLLRVTKQTIYNMLKTGRLTATKVGREWRFKRGDIDALLEPVTLAARGKELSPRDMDIVMEFIKEG